MKAIYELKQASRILNQKLDGELKRLGLKRSKFDTCVYCRNENGQIRIAAVYVDDLLVFSNNQRWVNQLKRQVTSKYVMKDLGLANKVLGIRVRPQKETVKDCVWTNSSIFISYSNDSAWGNVIQLRPRRTTI